MQTAAIQAAAEQLWQRWQTGQHGAALTHATVPATLTQGYAVQAALARLSGQPLAGWKIAATSTAGQTHIGVDGPIAGRLLADRFSHHPARLSLAGCLMRVAEAEFAFRLGVDLPPRDRSYGQDEVMAAVAALHPAIELPDSRFADFAAAGGAQLAADNACAHLFVLGPETQTDWRGVDLATHPVALHINGEPATRGRGGDALGDPRAALTWLANCEAVKPDGLRAGQVVTTGVCGQPSPIQPGDRVLADFGSFGQVEVTLE